MPLLFAPRHMCPGEMLVSSIWDTFYKMAPKGRLEPADGCGQNLRALRKLLSLGKKKSTWQCGGNGLIEIVLDLQGREGVD